MNKSVGLLLGTSLLIGTAASAQTACEQCGERPPPFVCKVKGNAGIGNGGDQRTTEFQDCDPGRSGEHNRAWKNMDKGNRR